MCYDRAIKISQEVINMTNRLKRTAAAATATVMCLSAMVGSAFAASPSFTDVPESHWAYSYVAVS